MWILGISIVAVVAIYVFHWLIMLTNPNFSKTSSSSLPPGSMGFPFIGETLQFMIPSYSLDLPPFITKRIRRFGPIFRTRLFGKPVVISADPEFNSYLVQHEGKLVELYVGPLSKVIDNIPHDYIHKYMRNLTLSHVGAASIRQKLLPQLEEMCSNTLHRWSGVAHTSVELKQSSSEMIFHFFAQHYFGYDNDKLPEIERIITERLFMISNLSKGRVTIPLNIPGTKYHKCLEEVKKTLRIIKNILEERRNSPENYRGDLLDKLMKDMVVEKIMSDDLITYVVFGLLFATYLSLSSLVTLIFKFLSEHPSVMEELRAEHEEILKRRDESSSSSLTWDEYKSMKFTLQVINEALRFTVLIPGLLRIALKDIQVKEYTIPAGSIILAFTPILHVNSEIYKDPLTFNPWRWKDLDSLTVSKNFMPFGGGLTQCPGAELTRAFMATFLHVLATKYRWKEIKGGRVFRNPMLGFRDGFHIKIWERDNN